MDVLKLIGRRDGLFESDVRDNEILLSTEVANARFLVIGGAGSIGKAIVREIFKRKPRALHCVDISENNMVELVREIRSTLGYIEGDFRTYAIDCGSREFAALIASGNGYDYVLNLSALKHVRSEKDPFTLMRMIEVNILNIVSTIDQATAAGAKKYFCVSTDKATNPVNMMGASKRIMEMFLMRSSESLEVSTARFANVAFSDGSLLHGFNQRFINGQPISAPNDVRRYFVTPEESGQLCLLSCIMGANRNIFFPKLSNVLHLTKFSDVAVRFLEGHGYTAFDCESEEEARSRSAELIRQRKWPVYFFPSDTTGEKAFEEFYTIDDDINWDAYKNIGVINGVADYDADKLNKFLKAINRIRGKAVWDKPELVEVFSSMITDFQHIETGKYLDEKM